MSTAPGRIRRASEWLWRGNRLRSLKEQRMKPSARRPFQEASSCQTLAWRALAGVEPIPAHTRESVARPLLVAGITKCLPLTEPRQHSISELFADPTWQQHLLSGGITLDALPALESWLLAPEDESKPTGHGQRGLLALNALLEALQGPERDIRGVRWRRVLVLASTLLLLGGMVLSVVALLTPPELPDLAANKPWQASSFYPGFPGSGNKPVNPTEGAFFSTNEDANPWWQVDLQAPTLIGGATVVNRGDCCIERATPLVLEVSLDGQSWREVSRRPEKFRTWRPEFAPTKARYVRLRALRRTFVHFKDVRVHAPRPR